jgi:hypothetical protein
VSTFPGAIDTFPTEVAHVSHITAADWNGLGAAVIAIETYLTPISGGTGVVHIAQTETITGAKTFSAGLTASGGTINLNVTGNAQTFVGPVNGGFDSLVVRGGIQGDRSAAGDSNFYFDLGTATAFNFRGPIYFRNSGSGILGQIDNNGLLSLGSGGAATTAGIQWYGRDGGAPGFEFYSVNGTDLRLYDFSSNADRLLFTKGASGALQFNASNGTAALTIASGGGTTINSDHIGFYGHSAVVQAAVPATLADVIAVLRGCGLTA